MKAKIAIVRGKFLNQYEMQSYEPLTTAYDLQAFGSLTSVHTNFAFPTVKLLSPFDLPNFPYKTPILNRLFTDAHYLAGLENSLQGFAIAHSAETYFHFTKQCLEAKKNGSVKKVVVTVWENIPFNNEGIAGRTEAKQQVLREADHFIAISERSKIALLLEGASEKNISVISPGVDNKVFFPTKEKAGETKKIQLLFVGRLVKNKGVYEMLHALKMLTFDKELKNIPILLTIIGSGPEKNGMQATAKKLGISEVIMYKEVFYHDMPREYRKADIFIAPSKEDIYWQEQWGMALLEAQASGLSIVTTTSGSIPENVGDAAFLVQPADILSLKEAIKKLILNPKLKEEYSKKARERAVKVHDIKIVASKIKRVYEKVLQTAIY